MLIAASTVVSIVATPILVASACISKLYSAITGFKPLDISRESFIKEMNKYIPTMKELTSVWVCNRKIHVLCRHASVFSNYPPIVIIHGTRSGSFNYSEFMESFPKMYDVYCIDLPGWGISEDPPFNLGSAVLERCYSYYANVIMSALTEIYPVKNAKFVFVGHSFGSFLLTKSIVNGYIPSEKIQKCVLTCAPGVHKETSKYAYFWGTIFITGIMESLFKQWWSSHLFSAFLYRKETQLLTLQCMHKFIPNGEGFKIVGRHMGFKGRLFKPEWINPIRNELIHMSKYNCNLVLICGLMDTIVNQKHTKDISDEIQKIKYHELKSDHSMFLKRDLFPLLLDIINTYPSKSMK
jgi:hypothetical protein